MATRCSLSEKNIVSKLSGAGKNQVSSSVLHVFKAPHFLLGSLCITGRGDNLQYMTFIFSNTLLSVRSPCAHLG